MESSADCYAASFRDLLESAGLKQHVIGLTHRSGHTSDLIIDRQEFSVMSDLPSDHSAVLCSVVFARPEASKSHFKQRRLEVRDIDMDALKSDLTNSTLSHDLHYPSDPNVLVDLYFNYVLYEALDQHTPEVSRVITLRPNAPWFTAELRADKRDKRRCERAYRASRLVIHEQIYRDQCRSYTALLEQSKTQYYKSNIKNANQKNLFRLIDGMFHVKTAPPLPSHDSIDELTEKFSSHFIYKISKLRQRFTQISTPKMSVNIGSTCHCSLAEFSEVSLETVRKTIQDSPSNSCPVDPLPTRILKA